MGQAGKESGCLSYLLCFIRLGGIDVARNEAQLDQIIEDRACL